MSDLITKKVGKFAIHTTDDHLSIIHKEQEHKKKLDLLQHFNADELNDLAKAVKLVAQEKEKKNNGQEWSHTPTISR